MTSPKLTKKNFDISPERLVEHCQATFITSTGLSLPLFGSKFTDELVEQVAIN